MGKLYQFLGLLTVLVISVQNSNAISCYECNSATDKRCIGEEKVALPEELKKSCPLRSEKPYTLCRKISQVIDFEVNGLKPDSRIIRTCGYEESSYSNRCYQRSGFGGRQEVCACKDDFCNGSSSLGASVLVTVIATIVAKFHL